MNAVDSRRYGGVLFFWGGYPRIIHFIRLNPDFLIPTIYGSPPFFEWVYFRRKN